MERSEATLTYGLVISNEEVAEKTFEMAIKAQDLPVSKFLPGQFICIPPYNSQNTFCRPFSVFRTNKEMNVFSILYRVVGNNTYTLSLIKEGHSINFWGPIGSLPTLPANGNLDIWLDGGGIGIAPLYFFLQNLEDKAKLFYGERTSAQLVFDPYSSGIINLWTATEDGSARHKGLITDLFEQEFAQSGSKESIVITCGPIPMMKKLAQFCESKGALCYVTLERVMACGIGICLGCSIKTVNGMKRICQEGPIFNSKEVIWDELNN